MTYIYSKDGTKKVNIDAAKLLGDVLDDLNIDRQGDNSQLWRSKGGSYFRGSCLNHAQGCGGIVSFCNFVPMSESAAKNWVLDYYGPDALERFGFIDDSEEI